MLNFLPPGPKAENTDNSQFLLCTSSSLIIPNQRYDFLKPETVNSFYAIKVFSNFVRKKKKCIKKTQFKIRY